MLAACLLASIAAVEESDRHLPRRVIPGQRPKMRDIPPLLEPQLSRAVPINSRTFHNAGRPPTIEVGAEAPGSHVVVSRPDTHAGWMRVFNHRSQPLAERLLDELLQSLLPLVTLDGKPVRLEDVFYCSFNIERGAYFPTIHWDYQWGAYPGTPGFQLWYLLERASASRFLHEGNMFLVDAPEKLQATQPVAMLVHADGSLRMSEFETSMPLKAFNSVEEAGMRFRYLNMSAGEVLVMSKRQLHFSDPRPLWRGAARLGVDIDRLAFNVRVVLQPPGWANNETLPMWSKHMWWKHVKARGDVPGPKQWVLARDSANLPLNRGYEQVRIPGRFAMVNWQ